MLHTGVMRHFLLGAVLGTALSGCYATASPGYYYAEPGVTVTATTVAPDLVYVSPGVQVIADYDEPIFYTDGYYWREYNGVWYRSTYHTHGWVYAAPPRTVVSIENRHSYRRYRPVGWQPRVRDHRDNGWRDRRDHEVRDRPQPRERDWRDTRPDVRDHRTPDARPVDHRGGWQPQPQPQPQPRNPGWRPQPAQPQPQPHTNDHRSGDDRQRDERDHRDHDRRDHRK